MTRLALLAALLLWVPPAAAQEHHAAGHPVYKNWQNKIGNWCCNNQDCGELLDSEVRESGDHTEVWVAAGKKWCPVQSWMMLKSGNTPNWDANHACVAKNSNPDPCAWLICFQPKPGT